VIERGIQRLAEELRLVTTQLAETQAWAFQIERVGTSERQALMGWLQTIRRIGAGTGKKVPALRRQAQEQMAQAKEAVPVWIMPISRVLENFSPASTTFDVIIVDEASQANLLGLIPLYMAKHVVVVGDHEQVSPDAVGEEVEEIQKLVELHLKDIPNRHLYDGRLSIYDLAQTSFSGAIMLVEHFRCDPNIIEFSNNLSYEGRIKPLRDTSGVVTKPAVIPYRVRNGYCEKKVNESEIVAVSSLLAACLTFPEYQTKPDGSPVSFGIISMLGTEQTQKIRDLLLEKLDPRAVERHRVLVGSPAQFQGDERDVIFISIVDSNQNGHVLPLRQSDMYKKRYNVAASRARDQLWVVHSLNHSTDLKAADLRRRLIEHAHDPAAVSTKIAAAERKADSIFERRVLETLIRHGYKVTPQWQVGKFRIDIVVEGRRNRLAVELDGEKYHPPEKLAEDMERQAMLERAGWQFVRVRGSLYFRDPERALKPLFETLTELGIEPEQVDTVAEKMSDGRSQEIIRTAEGIRRDWGYKDEAISEEGLTEEIPIQNSSAIEIDLPITIQSIAKALERDPNEVMAEAWKHLRFDESSIAPINKREIPNFLKLFNLSVSE
jgi:very-short-patch-repair endonuclease